MKFSIIATIAASAAFLSADKWCNTGTAGNGDCEKQGFHTFCCIGSEGDEYQHKKKTHGIGTGPDGSSWCGRPIPEEGTNEGVIYCAK
ncbi:hypothetical protein PRZ48_003497 [Zasmidium cellare]|uniref:Uncharacterized protein n=1 Tax=Zasmidium cellare TaxID=395010 RepID=A0ABR0EV78_ZASCE|nr:hypothetical protein PRZ48_003497 [Zasmidium cellare]